jgi:hypothetical protein
MGRCSFSTIIMGVHLYTQIQDGFAHAMAEAVERRQRPQVGGALRPEGAAAWWQNPSLGDGDRGTASSLENEEVWERDMGWRTGGSAGGGISMGGGRGRCCLFSFLRLLIGGRDM